MHKRNWIVLAVIVNHGYTIQRELVMQTGFSAGAVNASLKALVDAGYLDEDYRTTEKARAHIESMRPKRAVILAAGPGLRMAPLNHIPKALMRINNEPLIERLIAQLHAVGVRDISVVVGYMMERLEYLTERYGVHLVMNDEYTARDSLHSLALVKDRLDNCYVMNSDLWFSRNPFSRTEYFPWYAVSSFIDEDSFVRINRKMELVYTGDAAGNAMNGVCYLTEDAARHVRRRLDEMDKKRAHAKAQWEEALLNEDKMMAYARVLRGQTYFSVKTYKQLLELDGEVVDIMSQRRRFVAEALDIATDEVSEMTPLHKGMSNTLMRFSAGGEPYILRIPGEGSDKLADRRQEAAVYGALRGLGITDDVVYINPDHGYKISRYIEDVRVCDPHSAADVSACLGLLRQLHGMQLEAGKDVDLFARIERYESLLSAGSLFTDYAEVRANVMGLKPLLSSVPMERRLCHVDAIPDNFLIGNDKLYLIDWEYAGMGDPLVDVAAFCVYAGYDRHRIRQIAEEYLGGQDEGAFGRIYAYCAICGLMWAVWGEYKRQLGIRYEDYVIKQYKYARNYTSLAINHIGKR